MEVVLLALISHNRHWKPFMARTLILVLQGTCGACPKLLWMDICLECKEVIQTFLGWTTLSWTSTLYHYELFFFFFFLYMPCLPFSPWTTIMDNFGVGVTIHHHIILRLKTFISFFHPFEAIFKVIWIFLYIFIALSRNTSTNVCTRTVLMMMKAANMSPHIHFHFILQNFFQA